MGDGQPTTGLGDGSAYAGAYLDRPVLLGDRLPDHGEHIRVGRFGELFLQPGVGRTDVDRWRLACRDLQSAGEPGVTIDLMRPYERGQIFAAGCSGDIDGGEVAATPRDDLERDRTYAGALGVDRQRTVRGAVRPVLAVEVVTVDEQVEPRRSAGLEQPDAVQAGAAYGLEDTDEEARGAADLVGLGCDLQA